MWKSRLLLARFPRTCGNRGKPAFGFPRFPQVRHFHSSPSELGGRSPPVGPRFSFWDKEMAVGKWETCFWFSTFPSASSPELWKCGNLACSWRDFQGPVETGGSLLLAFHGFHRSVISTALRPSSEGEARPSVPGFRFGIKRWRWESGKPVFGFPLFHPPRRRSCGNVEISPALGEISKDLWKQGEACFWLSTVSTGPSFPQLSVRARRAKPARRSPVFVLG